MPFTVDQLSDIPVVMLTLSDSGMFQEMPDMEQRILPIFDALAEPAFMLVDMRAVRLGLDDVTKSANDTARDKPKLLSHPNLRELLVITQDRLLALAIQGMRYPIFGSIRIRAFESPEAALEYCRAQVAETAVKVTHKKSG